MTLILLLIYKLGGSLLLLSAINEPGDFMRETGKIHVVYGVITIVFIGITLFLVYLERKISRIEKRMNHDQIK